MGARGPLSKQSNVVRLVRGNPGGHTPKATVSQKTPPEAPSPPSWLPKEALAEWKRIVPDLDARGLLAKVDRAILAQYCGTWALWTRVFRELLEAESMVAPRNRGEGQVKNPLFQVLASLDSQLLTMEARLGMEPAARARLTIPEVDDEDPDGILD